MKAENKIRQFYYKKSRIQQYKGFCYTVQLGTTYKAGEKMGINPSAISMQIKALEEDLGVILFDRTANHRIFPNEAGLRLYKKLVPIIQSADGVLQEFLDEEIEEKRRTLNIAGHHIVLTNILPKYLAKLKNQKEFKDIKFKLFNISKEDAYRRTVDGEIDIMIYPIEHSEKPPVELEVNKILRYQSVVLLYKGHPLENKEVISANELTGSNFLLIDKFGVSKVMQHLIEDHNIGYDDVSFVNGNWAMLKSLVKAKIGICSFSKYFISEEDLKELIITPLLHVSDRIYFSYLTKKNSFKKDGIKYLINELSKAKDF